MTIPLYQVDSFTDRPFAGNPAGVCLLDAPREAEWMQHVAAEMNLSETAFIHPLDQGRYAIRYFTPAVEVALCGHATLASAHLLLEQDAGLDRLVFETHAGKVLTCQWDEQGRIEMDFPPDPVEVADPPSALVAALAVEPRAAARGEHDWLIEVVDLDAVRGVSPDFVALSDLARGVIVTAEAPPDHPADFVSRFFAPAVGINEDPVTGSAHRTLASYWSARLNRTAFTAQQVSARGGTLYVRLVDGRVRVAGHAVTVFEANLKAV